MSASDQSRRLSRSARLVAMLAAVVLVFAACGSDDDGDGDAVDAGDTPAAEDGTGTDTGPDTDEGAEDDAEDDAAPPEDADVTVIAEDIDFPHGEYQVAAGTVEIVYENEGRIVHTLVIQGVDGFKLAVNANGDVDDGSVELEPGGYELYCDIPGHRSAGMEATLVAT